MLAEAASSADVPLVQISTDYVFDGAKRTPYREDDPVAPLNVYGLSKEAGERLVRSTCPQHLILRTSWVFSPYGTNFVRTMLRLGAERGGVEDRRRPDRMPHLGRRSCRRDPRGLGQGRRARLRRLGDLSLSRRRYPHLARLRQADLRASRALRP